MYSKTGLLYAEVNTAFATCDSDDEINHSRNSPAPLSRPGQAFPLLQIDDALSFLGSWTESLPQRSLSEEVDQLLPTRQAIADCHQRHRAESRSAELHHLGSLRISDSIERGRCSEHRGSNTHRRRDNLHQITSQDAPLQSLRFHTHSQLSTRRFCRDDERNVRHQESHAYREIIKYQGVRVFRCKICRDVAPIGHAL